MEGEWMKCTMKSGFVPFSPVPTWLLLLCLSGQVPLSPLLHSSTRIYLSERYSEGKQILFREVISQKELEWFSLSENMLLWENVSHILSKCVFNFSFPAHLLLLFRWWNSLQSPTCCILDISFGNKSVSLNFDWNCIFKKKKKCWIFTMILSNKQQPSSWDVQLSWILTLDVVSHYGSGVWATSKMYALNLPSYLGIKIQCSYLGYLKCEAVNREIHADDSLSAIYYSLAIKKNGGEKKIFWGGRPISFILPKKKRTAHTTTIMKESKLPHMLKHFLATERPMLWVIPCASSPQGSPDVFEHH